MILKRVFRDFRRVVGPGWLAAKRRPLCAVV